VDTAYRECNKNMVLFRCEKILDFTTVALSFVCGFFFFKEKTLLLKSTMFGYKLGTPVSR